MSDILKKLLSKLYAWALPTALSVGIFYFVVFPRSHVGHGLFGPLNDGLRGIIFVLLVATIAFTLNAFSTQLYWFLQGYLLWPRWLQHRGINKHRYQRVTLWRQSKSKKIPRWKRGLALERLGSYPKSKSRIAPTRLGNIFSSFETYGKTRFNLDSNSLWFELCASAPDYLQNAYVEACAAVDFFVASFYLAFGLALLTFALAACHHDLQLFALSIAAIAFCAIAQWMAIYTTRNLSSVVKAIVHVGRAKLAENMGLVLPASLEQEKDMWGIVTHYSYFCTAREARDLNAYRRKYK